MPRQPSLCHPQSACLSRCLSGSTPFSTSRQYVSPCQAVMPPYCQSDGRLLFFVKLPVVPVPEPVGRELERDGLHRAVGDLSMLRPHYASRKTLPRPHLGHRMTEWAGAERHHETQRLAQRLRGRWFSRAKRLSVRGWQSSQWLSGRAGFSFHSCTLRPWVSRCRCGLWSKAARAVRAKMTPCNGSDILAQYAGQ